MKKQYLPKTPETRLAHLVEECGEVCQIVGKIGRFGLDAHHPQKKKTNRDRLLEEMADLSAAIERVRKDLLS